MSKYNEEFVKGLVKAYVEAEGYEAEQAVIVEKAKFTGFTIAGLRAKLSREGVYNAKVEKVTAKTIRKNELVTQLAELLGVNEEVVETFEKANRKPLEILVGRIRVLQEQVNFLEVE
jgi:hypothetical protein